MEIIGVRVDVVNRFGEHRLFFPRGESWNNSGLVKRINADLPGDLLVPVHLTALEWVEGGVEMSYRQTKGGCDLLSLGGNGEELARERVEGLGRVTLDTFGQAYEFYPWRSRELPGG